MEDLINRQVAIDKLSEIYYKTPNYQKGVESAIKVILDIPASDDASMTMMNSLYCLRETRNKLWEEVKDFLFKTLSEEHPILNEGNQRIYDEFASKLTLLGKAIRIIEEMEEIKHEKERQRKKKMIIKIMYYIRRIRWLWNHRDMKDCNRKFRMMEYDIRWDLDRRKTSDENS